jgi:hypothetical protein
MDNGKTCTTLFVISRSSPIASKAREGEDDAKDETNLYIDMIYVVLNLAARLHDRATCMDGELARADRGGAAEWGDAQFAE